MMAMTKIFKARLAGLLLLILSAYYVNSTMFYHQHVICGETIFHSHLSSASHAENPDSDGGHSLEVAKLIAILGQISIEEQSFESSTPEVEQPIIAICDQCESTVVQLFIGHCRSLRAPPLAI